MKKRLVALLLAMVMIIALVPIVAIAGATGTYDVNLYVDSSPETYSGQNALKVKFCVQSDNLKVKTIQSILFRYDASIFQLLTFDDSDAIVPVSLTSTKSVFSPYTTTRNWQANGYALESNGTGYVLLQPSGSSEKSCSSEICLSSILLGLKTGKTLEDASTSSISIGLSSDPSKFNEASVVMINSGTEGQYYLPSGKCIHGEGVEPDVKVKFDAEEYIKDIKPNIQLPETHFENLDFSLYKKISEKLDFK